MARPPSDLDDYLEWQKRLEMYKASGMNVETFCLQEGVSKTTFYRWLDRLKDGIPKDIADQQTETAPNPSPQAAFVPINLKASPVEIELPNGGLVRLPLGVGQAVLLDVVRVVGALRPWRTPKS